MNNASCNARKPLFLAIAVFGLAVTLPAAAQTKEEASEALKARLQRQEAASKMFDRKPEPAPAKPAAKAKETTPAPQAKAAAPVSSPAPAVKPAEIAPPPVAATPRPTPEPALQISAVSEAPVKQTAPQAEVVRALSRVEPEFPTEAMKAGADRGVVKARMTLDGGGNVTHVEIVEAQPRRVFDRAVVLALSQWKFNAGSSGRTYEQEVAFRLR